MAHQHPRVGAERAREPLSEVDRTVAPAGATDRNGDVVPVIAPYVGQPAREKAAHVLEERSDPLLAFQVFDHWRIESGEHAQRRLVVRVGQHPCVHNPVGVQWNAVAKRERLE